MDGNGRWATSLGEARTFGHREGSASVRRIVRACRRLGVEALTLYAFSEQNWDRPRIEVDALMALLKDFLITEREELNANGIRLRMVGRRHRLPDDVGDVLDAIAEETADLTRMTLTLALSYGGREEIADAAQEIARRAASGELDPELVDTRFFGAVLPSMEVGPVDLLIRTSGELRVSNFLLWATAYAELYFTDALWPDFDEVQLYKAIETYQARERRFGRVACSATEGGVDPIPLVAGSLHV